MRSVSFGDVGDVGACLGSCREGGEGRRWNLGGWVS